MTGSHGLRPDHRGSVDVCSAVDPFFKEVVLFFVRDQHQMPSRRRISSRCVCAKIGARVERLADPLDQRFLRVLASQLLLQRRSHLTLRVLGDSQILKPFGSYGLKST